MPKRSRKFFKMAADVGPTTNLGSWKKGFAPSTRRIMALTSRPKNWSIMRKRLSVARALQLLANVTKDNATRKAALADANYFFKVLRR